LKNWRRCI